MVSILKHRLACLWHAVFTISYFWKSLFLYFPYLMAEVIVCFGLYLEGLHATTEFLTYKIIKDNYTPIESEAIYWCAVIGVCCLHFTFLILVNSQTNWDSVEATKGFIIIFSLVSFYNFIHFIVKISQMWDQHSLIFDKVLITFLIIIAISAALAVWFYYKTWNMIGEDGHYLVDAPAS